MSGFAADASIDFIKDDGWDSIGFDEGGFESEHNSRRFAARDDFAKALAISDNIVLTDIYAARENDNLGISSEDLVEKIEKLGKKCWHFSSFSDIENFLLQKCIPGDMLITMGAGDVQKIGENLLGS